MIRRTGRGIDTLDARQLCNLVFAMMMNGLGERQRDEALDRLEAPPGWRPSES